MKRRISKDDEKESRLSDLLFSKSKKIVEKLNPECTNELVHDQKPAWADEDDENFDAITLHNLSSKSLYTEKLKQKYESLMGTPSWAKLNRQNKEEDESDEVLRTVGHLHKKKSDSLPKGYIQLKKFPLINQSTRKEGLVISSVEFHPKISAAMVAGDRGVVSLFSIGGDDNTKLHSFKLNGWKISTAKFTPDGSEALVTSKMQHNYCVYDLAKAQPKLVQLPQVIRHAVIFEVSNDGKFIAASDGFEEIFLLSLASKELLRAFKHNSKIVSVIFSSDNTQLYCYSVEGEITIWDLSSYKILKRFYDHGCVTASCLAASSCGKLLATGSGEGIVNIYQVENLTGSDPLPFKVISNLTTKITNITFNSTSEILAASSAHFPNAVKLVHIPSYNVFFNFPVQKFNLHHVSTLSFSPNSGFMSLGNNKGCAMLYRLKYYKNY